MVGDVFGHMEPEYLGKLLSSNDIIKKVKRQPTKWEKVFRKHTKGLIRV